MSTRSNIAFEYADGSVARIYCHWDGYLEHNGHILFHHYKNKEKIKKLIALGDISVLEYVFENIEVAKQKVEPQYFSDWQSASKNMEEYFYLYREAENKWYVLYTHSGAYKKGQLILLKEALDNLKDED
jgi:hypothetical protein